MLCAAVRCACRYAACPCCVVCVKQLDDDTGGSLVKECHGHSGHESMSCCCCGWVLLQLSTLPPGRLCCWTACMVLKQQCLVGNRLAVCSRLQGCHLGLCNLPSSMLSSGQTTTCGLLAAPMASTIGVQDWQCKEHHQAWHKAAEVTWMVNSKWTHMHVPHAEDHT